MDAEETILIAAFNPKVCTYWLLSGALVLLVCIVTIPLLPIWFLCGQYFTKRYLSRMECELTSRVLKVKKGLLIRVEKTIPLEKITDMGMVQGPLMRHLDLHKLTVETAGTSGAGSLVSLTGIVGAKEFREAVLKQRDRQTENSNSSRTTPASTGEGSAALLREIRDTLKRIEAKLPGE